MTLERALKLKVGQVVSCPADRGDKAYTGRITHISPVVCKNLPRREDYIWVEVQGPTHRTVWPSNRLG